MCKNIILNWQLIGGSRWLIAPNFWKGVGVQSEQLLDLHLLDGGGTRTLNAYIEFV